MTYSCKAQIATMEMPKTSATRFANHLLRVPGELLEVLQSRDTGRMTVTELRMYLSLCWFAHADGMTVVTFSDLVPVVISKKMSAKTARQKVFTTLKSLTSKGFLVEEADEKGWRVASPIHESFVGVFSFQLLMM